MTVAVHDASTAGAHPRELPAVRVIRRVAMPERLGRASWPSPRRLTVAEAA
jgi:hypothetical protein